MARLLIHLEGQTEEDFVNEILRDYLVERGYEDVSARIVGNARLRQRRGGIRPWPSVKRDIIHHLREDPFQPLLSTRCNPSWTSIFKRVW